jgi:hypothetical protein
MYPSFPQIEKAYDLVLTQLISANELATGYQPLVQKVTRALNTVNRLMRETVEEPPAKSDAGATRGDAGATRGDAKIASELPGAAKAVSNLAGEGGDKCGDECSDKANGNAAARDEGSDKANAAASEKPLGDSGQTDGAAAPQTDYTPTASPFIRRTTKKILKLEEQKFPVVAAIHMEKIKLYSESRNI